METAERYVVREDQGGGQYVVVEATADEHAARRLVDGHTNRYVQDRRQRRAYSGGRWHSPEAWEV